jgi:4-hydroxy-3-polyprenylbenzoate decarboxylase
LKIVVGISGSSGIIYGIRFLEVLKELGIESHTIMTEAAVETMRRETRYDEEYTKSISTYFYNNDQLWATISSGSFMTNGMAVIPCSMRTLAGIATGYAENLLLRSASVSLKEKRTLVVVPRETPLSIIHIKNMLEVAQAGGIILPPIPAFYNKPKTVDDIINHTVGKVLDMFGIEHNAYRRWGE